MLKMMQRGAAALGLALGMMMGAAPASAEDFRAGVVYDMGGKFDGSFNEAAFRGLERFTKETKLDVMEFQLTNDAQREQAMRRMIDRGAKLVIAVGFSQADALKAVAAENPNVKFAIIDVFWLEGDNIAQYAFREHEGSYIVGVAAALKSKTGKVGFVGGMDIPLIRKFACGYAQGVKSVKADAEVFQNMTGTTPAAWNDPTKGGELATTQFDRGADVVYHAAGGTGIGVIRAAADRGLLAIGVDSNQNGTAPGSVLTSMLKRVDVAVYEALMSVKNDSFKGGVQILGLAEGGVDWAVDENNKPLLTPEITAAVEKAKKDIIDGKVKVHDYTSDEKCPV